MRARRLTSHRRAAASVAIGLGALSVVIAPIAASASSAHKKLTPLQQGLAFYKGKTITLISPDNVGGGFDTTSRIVAPYLATYLGATVNVTNDAPAATVAGQDLLAASPADGLTLGMVNPGADAEDIVTGTPGVNFNPQKLQFLGGNNSSPTDFECNSSSQWTSFASVVHSTTPVPEVIVGTGTQTLNLDLMNAAFGIKAQVIGGFQSTSAELAGQEAGTGQCSVLGINTPAFATYAAGGKAKILMVTKLPNPATGFYNLLTSAPSLAQAEKQFPATTKNEKLARAALLTFAAAGIGHEFNAPARTASYKVVALRAAVQAALTNVKCEDALLASGQQNGWVTGPRAFQSYKNVLAALKPVAPIIKTALGV
jgi:tripartite-type tricarboxylate transporter receptor subunit TctC